MSANSKKSKFTIGAFDRPAVSAAQVAANRAKIAEQERRVRLGLLQPVVLPLGNAAKAAGLDVIEDYLE